MRPQNKMGETISSDDDIPPPAYNPEFANQQIGEPTEIIQNRLIGETEGYNENNHHPNLEPGQWYIPPQNEMQSEQQQQQQYNNNWHLSTESQEQQPILSIQTNGNINNNNNNNVWQKQFNQYQPFDDSESHFINQLNSQPKHQMPSVIHSPPPSPPPPFAPAPMQSHLQSQIQQPAVIHLSFNGQNISQILATIRNPVYQPSNENTQYEGSLILIQKIVAFAKILKWLTLISGVLGGLIAIIFGLIKWYIIFGMCAALFGHYTVRHLRFRKLFVVHNLYVIN